MEKNINVSINEGEAFFAHEISVNFNPMQFIFDFKSITPRIDMRAQQGQTVALKHNVVMLDPYHVQRFHALLGDVLKKYEKEFGKIEKPKAVEAFEKKAANQKDIQKDKHTLGTPTYFG